MSEEEYKELSDLNKVAIEELKSLLNQNEDLDPEWKEVMEKLLDSNTIPTDIDQLKKIVNKDDNDNAKIAKG